MVVIDRIDHKQAHERIILQGARKKYHPDQARVIVKRRGPIATIQRSQGTRGWLQIADQPKQTLDLQGGELTVEMGDRAAISDGVYLYTVSFVPPTLAPRPGAQRALVVLASALCTVALGAVALHAAGLIELPLLTSPATTRVDAASTPTPVDPGIAPPAGLAADAGNSEPETAQDAAGVGVVDVPDAGSHVATLLTARAQLPEGIDGDDVHAQFEQELPRLDACRPREEQGADAGLIPQGEVAIEWKISGTGEALDVREHASTLDDEGISLCVQSIVQEMDFQPPAEPDLKVIYYVSFP